MRKSLHETVRRRRDGAGKGGASALSPSEAPPLRDATALRSDIPYLVVWLVNSRTHVYRYIPKYRPFRGRKPREWAGKRKFPAISRLIHPSSSKSTAVYRGIYRGLPRNLPRSSGEGLPPLPIYR